MTKKRAEMKRMTIDQFLKALAETPRDWRLFEGVRLRRIKPNDNVALCPISAVTTNPDHTLRPSRGGLELGLRRDVTRRMMLAADGILDDDLALRKRLLRACGLTEEDGKEWE